MQIAEELSKLAALRDRGVISEELFERAKATMLGGDTVKNGIADELEKLIGLRAKGVISGEELARAELALLGPAPRPGKVGMKLSGAPDRTAAAPEVPTWFTSCFTLLLLLLAIWAVSTMLGGDDVEEPEQVSGTTTFAPAPAAPDPVRVTSSELASAYKANEAAAQQRFGGKPLLVSGTIEAVELDLSDEPVIRLATREMFTSTRADLSEASQRQATLLRKGQTVTLLCSDVGEIVGDPMLRECDIQ